MKEQVRVLRLLEYVGDRRWVESQIRRSIHGEQVFYSNDEHGGGVIRAVSLNEFPEIVAYVIPKEEKTDDTSTD